MVDFGFVSLPTSQHFEVIPLKKDRMLCILSDEHPLAEQNEISFEMIKEEPLIKSKKGSDNDLIRILKENNVTPNIKFELSDDQAIISMVENGMGISILPEMVLHRVPNNVRILKLEGENYRTIGIAATSFKTLAPATKKFIEYLKSWLSELLHTSIQFELLGTSQTNRFSTVTKEPLCWFFRFFNHKQSGAIVK